MLIAFKLVLLISALFIISSSVNTNCSTSSILTGCLTCPSSFYRVIDISTQEYVCSDIINCTQVEGINCTICDVGLILFNNTCLIGTDFCLSYNSSDICIQCQPNYYLSSNNTCIKKVVTYCIAYNGNSCISCQQNFMNPNTNCDISVSVCLNFDYQLWKCTRCQNGMNLDASGLYCYTFSSNCIQYSYDINSLEIKCSKCQQNYILNTSTYSCDFSNSIQYVFIVNNIQQGICININQFFNSSTSICQNSATSIPYCVTNTSTTQCSKCFPGYYLGNSTCSKCSESISNCIYCQNSTNCLQCSPNYYLLQQSTSTVSQCIDCSTFNCDICYSTSTQIICLSCQRGYNLYQGQCYFCGSGYRFDALTKSCLSCSLISVNCQYCDQSKCTWCLTGYVLNGSSCLNISQLTTINFNQADQLIIKSFPMHQTQIYKNKTQLLANCQQSSNQYACLCLSNANITSLCYTISPSLLNLSVTAFSSGVTNSVFQQNSNTIRMLSQLPAFNSTTITLTNSFISSLQTFGNVIQTISNIVRKNSVTSVTSTSISNNNYQRRILIQNQNSHYKVSNTYSDSLITMFLSVATGSMINAFSLTTSTQIYGNGYYFKYNPANVVDTNTNFISTNLSTASLTYVWFDNYANSLSLTGNFYIYQPTVALSTVQVKVKQLYFPSDSYSYSVYKNNILQNISVTSTSDGYLILLVSSSNSSSLNSYQVQYTTISSVIQSFYADQRIQQIFYRMSFIYILIFLVAYLFFIPYCTIVDLCDKHATRRKRVRSQDITVTQQRQGDSQQQKGSTSQTSVVIAVNYKDFFPIYNIANTPRPRRLLKLCLFIVNLQHGITFLTLIYFNLGANNPVIAVVLAVPAYLCTIIMGYICGALVLFLPGITKYFINLISIGYWILWVALMPMFLDPLYYPYIYIFAIVFILIDILIDFLQTFLVYFVVKNSQRQISMFKCIATWLSYRGFYQFDKLAKQMIQS